MAGVGFSRSLVAFLIFTFYQEIHALQNSPVPSPSMSSAPIKLTELKIGVPRKTEFTEFVSVVENARNLSYGGICLEIFEEVIKTLNYSFKYYAFGDGVTEPDYDGLIRSITEKKFDAVVGDVTITANRSNEVVFTQPFIDSGLLVAVRLNNDYITSGFSFLKPFTARVWVLTFGFFITGGLAIYLLERQKHQQLQGSKPSRSCGSILWLGFSSMFTNQNDIKTVLGRLVVIACLFVGGTLYSCYTANLSAILTAQRLEPTFSDLHSVLGRNHIKIGIQNGSFVRSYLTENLGIDKGRLISLNKKDDYYKALFSGEVGAIIDERPYMLSLMENHCNNITFLGQTFATFNWGFAFHPMYDELVKDISKRILNILENGTLNNILKDACDGYTQSASGQLDVYNIWGLFVMSGLVIFIVLLLYMVRRKWKPSLIPTATSRQASASHGRGGFKLKNTVQFLRKARLSLNSSERRKIVIAPAQVTLVFKDSINHSGSTPL